METSLEYQKLVYLPPWCRLQAYLMGVWAGYFLFITKNKEVKLSRVS